MRARRWAAVLIVLPALVWLATVVARQRATEPEVPMTLVASSPAAGAELSALPGGVELTWSAPADVRLSHVVVQDSDGREVPAGELRAGPDNVLHLPITEDTGGLFTLGYHVVGTDGAEAAGSLRFSVDAGPVPAGPVPAGPAPAVDTHRHGGVDPASAVLLLINFAVVAGAVIMLLLRPRPRRPVA